MFATRIKNLDWWKSILIALIFLFLNSQLLEFARFKGQRCCHASLVSVEIFWSVDISHSVFVLIPWSAPIDHLIPGCKRFYKWLVYLVSFILHWWISCITKLQVFAYLHTWNMTCLVQLTVLLHRLEEHPVGEVGSKDVAVEMVMCVVNPSDINQIQGDWPCCDSWWCQEREKLNLWKNSQASWGLNPRS